MPSIKERSKEGKGRKKDLSKLALSPQQAAKLMKDKYLRQGAIRR